MSDINDSYSGFIIGKIKSVITDPRPGDPAVLLADISKAKDELNWSPKFTLKDILTSSWQGLGNS